MPPFLILPAASAFADDPDFRFDPSLGAADCSSADAVAASAFPATFFTGKPRVAGLGHAFLFRSYRADLSRWPTLDPLGYPDGWNGFVYGVDSPLQGIDLFGASWDNSDFVAYYLLDASTRPSYVDTDVMELTSDILPQMKTKAESAVDGKIMTFVMEGMVSSGYDILHLNVSFGVNYETLVFAMGGGSGRASGWFNCSWSSLRFWESGHLYELRYYDWSGSASLTYYDEFKDPADLGNWFEKDWEVLGGTPYSYGHVWNDIFLSGHGVTRKILE